MARGIAPGRIAWRSDRTPAVVLEYIDGHPLEHELRSHGLAPDRIWEIMIQVTSAIQHAHATGLVHREPKPPRQLDPQIPAELERICPKCLTKTITERYLTAADLAEDLRRAREAPARRRRRFATAGSKSAVVGPGQESTPGTKQETPSSKQDLAAIKQPSGAEAKAAGERPSSKPATATKTSAGTTPEATSYGAIGGQATELKPAEWVPLAIERNLPAKKTTGAAKWSAAGGVLKGEGLVGWVATEHEFADFEFSLEYRLGKDGHSGIFLRAGTEGPPDGSDSLGIPLLDDTSPRFAAVGPMERTAAVFRTAAPSPPVKGTPDVWHAMTIRAVGPRIRVQHEGRTVVDVDLEEAKTGIAGHRRATGRIGLQNLGTWVEFRNLVVRRLRRLDTKTAPSAPPPLAIAPFDAKKAKEHQAAWAKHLGVPVEFTNSIGMKLVLIPAGEFEMGSPESEPDRDGDELQHRVRITKPCYLGVYEVTQAEYERVMGANPRENPG